MNKPKELEENELSHMLSIFIEDLKKMKEENENENTLSSIDKYCYKLLQNGIKKDIS